MAVADVVGAAGVVAEVALATTVGQQEQIRPKPPSSERRSSFWRNGRSHAWCQWKAGAESDDVTYDADDAAAATAPDDDDDDDGRAVQKARNISMVSIISALLVGLRDDHPSGSERIFLLMLTMCRIICLVVFKCNILVCIF